MINTPFNYTGSKFKLLEQIIPELDQTKNYFVDLFTGGGSVYTNVVHLYDKILVNDIIEDLIGIHKSLIESDNIVNNVKKICPDKTDKIGFLQLRKDFNENKTPDKLWSLMLSCNSNMMRFNKRWEFNQTFGQRSFNSSTQKKIDIYTEHIRKYKNKLFFISKNFNEIKITKSSMVYCDPPYLETEAGYNSYYSVNDDKKLYNYLLNLDKENHSFMISGVIGDHKNGKRSKLIDKLVDDGFNYKILNHNYNKISKSKTPKKSNEIIIMNY